VELRHYWRVLTRRRNVIRNTFLIVALLSLVLVAYSYYNAQYVGHAKIQVQVRPDYSRAQNPNYDAVTTAQQNTTTAVQELTSYAATVQYFKDINAEMGGKPNDWKGIQQGMKVYQLPDSHDVYIEYDGANQNKVNATIKAATHQFILYIPTFQRVSAMPTISNDVTDPPTAQHVGLTTPLQAFLLRLVIGLVAGIILAYLFEYLDDTVQDGDDVARWMGLPTLAVVPGSGALRTVGGQARLIRGA